ncbi:hypothetical protein H9P43_007457 [Blastocladiella emersonii ATCC 22665]|nr:hypothetical protein H9P43_007457 [Blastocladiella emersonii ATCC 22665]
MDYQVGPVALGLCLIGGTASLLNWTLLFLGVRGKLYRNSVNLLIMSLAASDLLFVTVNFPTSFFIYFFYRSDPRLADEDPRTILRTLPSLCMFNGTMNEIAVVSSMMTISLMTYERYMRIVVQKVVPHSTIVLLVAGLWVSSAFMAVLPFLFPPLAAAFGVSIESWTVGYAPQPSGVYCTYDWASRVPVDVTFQVIIFAVLNVTAVTLVGAFSRIITDFYRNQRALAESASNWSRRVSRSGSHRSGSFSARVRSSVALLLSNGGGGAGGGSSRRTSHGQVTMPGIDEQAPAPGSTLRRVQRLIQHRQQQDQRDDAAVVQAVGPLTTYVLQSLQENTQPQPPLPLGHSPPSGNGHLQFLTVDTNVAGLPRRQGSWQSDAASDLGDSYSPASGSGGSGTRPLLSGSTAASSSGGSGGGGGGGASSGSPRRTTPRGSLSSTSGATVGRGSSLDESAADASFEGPQREAQSLGLMLMRRSVAIVGTYFVSWGMYDVQLLWAWVTGRPVVPHFDAVSGALASLICVWNPVLSLVMDRRFKDAWQKAKRRRSEAAAAVAAKVLAARRSRSASRRR